MTTTIEFGVQAMAAVQAMGVHIRRLRDFYGRDSELYRTAAESLAHSLVSVFGLGGRVVEESHNDHPGLYGVSAAGLHFGCVFHAAAVPDWVDEPMRAAAPAPGEWSLHS